MMDLRLVVITDHAAAAPRPVIDVVRECLEAGAPAIQLRDKAATARSLYEQAREVRELTSAHGALFIVNDRLDVAMAARADGVHLGPDDVPIQAARRSLPDSTLIGYSTDEPDDAVRARGLGADYIGCGAVFGTETKREAAGERIGVERLDAVAAAVEIPVLGIGGIGPDNVAAVAQTRAAGAAVVRSVMRAAEPAAAVRRLLAGITTPPQSPGAPPSRQ